VLLIRNTQASESRPEFCVQVIGVDGLDLAVCRDGKHSPSKQLIKLRLERLSLEAESSDDRIKTAPGDPSERLARTPRPER